MRTALVILILGMTACIAGTEEKEVDGLALNLTNGSTTIVNSNFGASMASYSFVTMNRGVVMMMGDHVGDYWQCSGNPTGAACVHVTGGPSNDVIALQNCFSIRPTQGDLRHHQCDVSAGFAWVGTLHMVLYSDNHWAFAMIWNNLQIVSGEQRGSGARGVVSNNS